MTSTLDSDLHTPVGGPFVGRPIERKEDPRLLTGEGYYVDDILFPGMLYAAIVRSSEAHARIVSIDSAAAGEHPDVVAVFTGADLDALGVTAPCPMIWEPKDVPVRVPEHWPLAKGKVGYVGQPVAVVLGYDRYSVVDAAEGVDVEYQPLPVVIDPERALADDAPVIHEEFGTNKVFEMSVAGGDVDAALRDADVVVERRIVNHRIAGGAIEPRGCVARWRHGKLTLWTSTQAPQIVRTVLSIQLGLADEKIRVIAPDVGGGFGAKVQVYPEEVLACGCARLLRRPVKWIATRSEEMATAHHGRDQIDYVRIGAKRDGSLTGIHLKLIQDCGSYHLLEGPVIPTFTSVTLSGCYAIPALRADIIGVFTNKFTTDAIRGAGGPEATHLIEVCMDELASELGIDRLELRRRNFITEFPARLPHGFVYDSGDYHGALDRLLEHLDLPGFLREQAALRDRGIYRGVGFSSYIGFGGAGPTNHRYTGPDTLITGDWESANLRVHASGSATLYTGSSSHGQGHETVFAQIVADRLGITPDQVEVIHGDTDMGPTGKGTFASRSVAVGGEAAARCAEKVRDKAIRIMAHLREVEPRDIELSGRRFVVRGVPDSAMTLAEIARRANVAIDLPERMEPGLDETTFFQPDNFVWPFGAHACVVEVDVETGKVDIVRYVAVDDCGRAINPLTVDGQIHGGITQAIGQALFEQVVYDANGQLLTGTFADYSLPSAAEVPSFETDRTETPTSVNSLGARGVGESGTIAATPAILNAVADALRPLGVGRIDMPLSPLRIWNYLQDARRHRSEQEGPA